MTTLPSHEAQALSSSTEPESQAQTLWAAAAISARLRILQSARRGLAAAAGRLVDSLPASLARTRADSLAAELLPLLDACRFLERNAARILKTRRLGRRGLPFWLSGLDSRVERVALGRVLIIGPANYPLFLPGVQALQALAAGNAVVWKPGREGRPVADLFQEILAAAGLPEGLLRVTGDAAEDGIAELHRGVDKVVFTGSAAAGKAVARLAAETATPVVAELSGCDALVVLPSADFARVADAVTFGMRLNGSATCMAPRRLFLVGSGFDDLIERLRTRFASMPAVDLAYATKRQLRADLDEAQSSGASVIGAIGQPILVLHGRPEMRIAQADIFAPVLTVLQVADTPALLQADSLCPFGLTISIFGQEQEARLLGRQLCAGTILINDLIVPTADPRVPFGGRRASGYGVTRGAEGLQEMTAVKTVLARRGNDRRHYEPTGQAHEHLFGGLIALRHAGGWRHKKNGIRAMVAAIREMQ